jgi:hypothetical protein
VGYGVTTGTLGNGWGWEGRGGGGGYFPRVSRGTRGGPKDCSKPVGLGWRLELEGTLESPPVLTATPATALRPSAPGAGGWGGFRFRQHPPTGRGQSSLGTGIGPPQRYSPSPHPPGRAPATLPTYRSFRRRWSVAATLPYPPGGALGFGAADPPLWLPGEPTPPTGGVRFRSAPGFRSYRSRGAGWAPRGPEDPLLFSRARRTHPNFRGPKKQKPEPRIWYYAGGALGPPP